MSDVYVHGDVGGAIRSDGGRALARRAANWLYLAASPTFALMALLTGVLNGAHPELLCSAAEHTSRLSGMIPMYLLMSGFHAPPWLKLISSQGGRLRRA
jgi:hypothetical protein